MFDIAGAIKSIAGLFSTALEKWIPDANLREQAAMELAQQASVQIMAQVELNKTEAASPSLFISGWRPATGWVCVGGLVYQVMVRPIVQSCINVWTPTYTMVPLEIETLMTLLFGMLGLGAYRTVEKWNGTTK
jgi:hypothetical protein